jgi:hypothetical protein
MVWRTRLLQSSLQRHFTMVPESLGRDVRQIDRSVTSIKPHGAIVVATTHRTISGQGNESSDNSLPPGPATISEARPEECGAERETSVRPGSMHLGVVSMANTELLCLVRSMKDKANQLRAQEADIIRRAIQQTDYAHKVADEAMDAMQRGSQWRPVEPFYKLIIGQYYWIQRTQYEGHGIPESRVGAPVLCRWEGRAGWSGHMPPGTSLLLWD